MGSSLHCTPVFNLLIINRNIDAKSYLLLNPLFPVLKNGIIHLFIVSLPKVPEFWCYFFLKHKITNFRELLLFLKSLNRFIEKIIDSHEKIELYFDNDKAGNRATNEVKQLNPHVEDYRTLYQNYKDLNDFIMSEPICYDISAKSTHCLQ